MSMVDFKCTEYSDGRVVGNEETRRRIVEVGIRKVARQTGIHSDTITLIVDDSPVVRQTLCEMLERQDGWKVCGEAVDGRDAIEKAQRLKQDLVLLDHSMPEMNSLEAARELKRLLPSVPLVMFTGFETAHLK